jgi:hypothetical protein
MAERMGRKPTFRNTYRDITKSTLTFYKGLDGRMGKIGLQKFL